MVIIKGWSLDQFGQYAGFKCSFLLFFSGERPLYIAVCFRRETRYIAIVSFRRETPIHCHCLFQERNPYTLLFVSGEKPLYIAVVCFRRETLFIAIVCFWREALYIAIICFRREILYIAGVCFSRETLDYMLFVSAEKPYM